MLFIADEVQTGFGRTGKTFACDHEHVGRDLWSSARRSAAASCRCPPWWLTATSSACSSRAITAAPSAATRWPAAVGRAVVDLLATGEFQARATELGTVLRERLAALIGSGVVGVRVRGLWAGIDIDLALGTGRDVREARLERGILAKDTHGSTVRLAPPLVISEDDLIWGLDQLAAVVGA